MVFEPNERIRKKMRKDGSVLKFMYSVAGVGKGLAAGGLMLVFIGVVLAAMLMPVFETPQAVMVGGVGVIPGLLLAVGGAFLQKRRDDGWLKAYARKSKLPESDILQADEELKGQKILLFSAITSKNTNNLKKMGFITPHYIKFPGIHPSLAHLQDLTACFYTKKYLCKDGGYDKAFVAYSRDKKLQFLTSDIKEAAAQEIVDVIASRNPAVITSHHFQYQGKEYDAVRDMDAVIALYNTVTGADET